MRILGPLGEYLDNLSRHGTAEMIYTDPVTKESVQFNSHEHLDEFVAEKMK